MKYLILIALALAISPAHARYHHVPVVKAVKGVPAHHHGQRVICIANPAGFFICAVAVGIIVHEVMGPACASNTKANRDHGYDSPTWWRPLCGWRDPNTVSVRG